MKIGIDLDGTLYAYPEFFRELIVSLRSRGHFFFCTSGHLRREWDSSDRGRLLDLGVHPDWIDPCLLAAEPQPDGPIFKASIADQLDLVFDEDAPAFQRLTRTPIFRPATLRGGK